MQIEQQTVLELKDVRGRCAVKLVDVTDMCKEEYSSICLNFMFLAVGKHNAKIDIFRVTEKEFQKIGTILAHSHPVFSMAILKNTLFTGQSIEDALIKIWNLDDLTLKRTLKGHEQPIEAITIYNDKLCASTSSDKTARVWELTQSNEIMTTLKHHFPLLAIQFISQSVIATGGDDCLLSIWDWRKKERLHMLLSHTNSLRFIQKIGSLLITGGGDGFIKIYQVDDLFDDDKPEAKTVEISKKSLLHKSACYNFLAISDSKNKIVIYDTKQDNVIPIDIEIPYHLRLYGLALFDGGRRILTAQSSIRHWLIGKERSETSLNIEHEGLSVEEVS